jgi:hypothetical protein
MAEAAAQFHKGLDQLALLPDTLERQRQELEFCSALGAALLAVKGFAAPETGHAYARAGELWEQLGSPYLRELGVASIGHRRRRLDAIAVPGAEVPTTVTAAARNLRPARSNTQAARSR